jgi:hypothetical protein
MRARTAWLAGAAGAAIAVYRKLRPQPAAVPEADPRAEELRRTLEDSRTVDEEQHEEAASPEATGADAEADVESRRAAVHERARAATDEMRGE